MLLIHLAVEGSLFGAYSQPAFVSAFPQGGLVGVRELRRIEFVGLGLNDVLSKFQHLSGDFHVRNLGKSALFPRSLSPACCAWRLPGGTFITKPSLCCAGIPGRHWRRIMHGIIYLVGLIVVILAVLSFFGLR
jgi:hypothetical protein